MARFNQWTQLLKASATSRRHDEKSDGVKQDAISFWIRLWEARTLVTM